MSCIDPLRSRAAVRKAQMVDHGALYGSSQVTSGGPTAAPHQAGHSLAFFRNRSHTLLQHTPTSQPRTPAPTFRFPAVSPSHRLPAHASRCGAVVIVAFREIGVNRVRHGRMQGRRVDGGRVRRRLRCSSGSSASRGTSFLASSTTRSSARYGKSLAQPIHLILKRIWVCIKSIFWS